MLTLRAGTLLGALMLLSGCGAGLITGVSLGQGGSSTPAARPPELSLPALWPLVPAANTTRTIFLTNAQVSGSAQLRVTIDAAGVTEDQVAPTAVGQAGSTAITFTLATERIVAAVGDPAAGDIEGHLAVLVDGQPIAAPVAIVLVRQPTAAVELLPNESVRILSPAGEAVTLRVAGLRSFEAAGLQMFVTTRDPENAGAPLTRACTGLTVASTGTPGEALVTAVVPGTATPDRALLFVRDDVAGESRTATVYYRPEVTLVLPSQGPTTGGNLMTLIGTGLVPRDFTQAAAPLAFDRVDLAFEKDGRVVDLPRSDYREELSAGDRLVFRMPASPDGRPGQVDIVLTAHLDGVDAVVSSSLFLYANPHPFFGSRGAVLDQAPVAVTPIALDGAPSVDDAPDFAVLTDEGGSAFVQLLLAEENGMFLRFGAARRIADHEVPEERDPRDLCTADFDGDGVPDLFVVNAGAATAPYDVVLGQTRRCRRSAARTASPATWAWRIALSGRLRRRRPRRRAARARSHRPGPAAARGPAVAAGRRRLAGVRGADRGRRAQLRLRHRRDRRPRRRRQARHRLRRRRAAEARRRLRQRRRHVRHRRAARLHGSGLHSRQRLDRGRSARVRQRPAAVARARAQWRRRRRRRRSRPGGRGAAPGVGARFRAADPRRRAGARHRSGRRESRRQPRRPRESRVRTRRRRTR
ncbi:MAG: hypothetical protein U1E73_11270 [Planctomycetota bacterium]